MCAIRKPALTPPPVHESAWKSLSRPKWKLYPEPDGETWFGFESVRPITELGDDLAIVPLAGHSAGHCGIAIRTEGHWVLHAGDAFFHRHDLDPAKEVPWGLRLFQTYVDRDRAKRRHNTARLRSLHAARANEVSVICSHDPEQLMACQQRAHRTTQL